MHMESWLRVMQKEPLITPCACAKGKAIVCQCRRLSTILNFSATLCDDQRRSATVAKLTNILSKKVYFSVSIMSVCRWRRENRQFGRSTHLNDLHEDRRKTGHSMLRILWHGPQASQIVHFTPNTQACRPP